MHNFSILLQAELGSASEEAPLSTSGGDASNIEEDDFFQIPCGWETL